MGLINFRGAGAGLGGAMEASGMAMLKSQLDEQRQARLAELQAGYASKAQERGFAQDEKMVGVRETSRREGAMYDVENIDPLKNQNALTLAKDTAQAKIDIETSPENVGKYVERLKTLGPVEARLKADADLTVLLAKGTPEALAATRAIAKASQVLTPGQVAEGEINQFKLSQAKLLDAFQTSYADAVSAKDMAKANSIAETMAARFFDPAKMKEDAPLKAAVAMINSMDATDVQKSQASDFITKRLAASSAKFGGGNDPSNDPLGLRAKLPKPGVPTKPGATAAATPAAPGGIIGSSIPGNGPRPGSFAERLRNRGLKTPLEDDESELNPN